MIQCALKKYPNKTERNAPRGHWWRSVPTVGRLLWDAEFCFGCSGCLSPSSFFSSCSCVRKQHPWKPISRKTGLARPSKSSTSALRWGPILAGAFAASTVTVILLMVGSGLGLTMVSPWSSEGAGITAVAASTAIWLIVVQWLSSAVGGYLAGRLRTKWVNIHSDEVYFRDTAHGFMAWAVATIIVISLLGSAVSSIVGGGVQAASTVASGAALGATASAENNNASGAASYFVDALFRPSDTARLAQPSAPGNEDAIAQASRILVQGAVAGEISDADRTYLAQLVAARAGLSEPDAKARVDDVLKRIDEAKIQATQAADSARKAAATFALVGALSLVIGAFIASAAALIGGKQRDDDEVSTGHHPAIGLNTGDLQA